MSYYSLYASDHILAMEMVWEQGKLCIRGAQPVSWVHVDRQSSSSKRSNTGGGNGLGKRLPCTFPGALCLGKRLS